MTDSSSSSSSLDKINPLAVVGSYATGIFVGFGCSWIGRSLRKAFQKKGKLLDPELKTRKAAEKLHKQQLTEGTLLTGFPIGCAAYSLVTYTGPIDAYFGAYHLGLATFIATDVSRHNRRLKEYAAQLSDE